LAAITCLDDKYNIATNTIPNGVVDQVQVMENHQPIKMLKDKVVSEDVALNLTMKKDAKLQLVGQETIGAGLPGNYYGELNAMMFKDKYKAINYIKGNNTGMISVTTWYRTTWAITWRVLIMINPVPYYH
jgi:hypothetical protein